MTSHAPLRTATLLLPLVLLAALLLPATQAHADGQLVGQTWNEIIEVRDVTDLAIAGSTVTLYHVTDAQEVAVLRKVSSATTNRQGEARVGVPVGLVGEELMLVNRPPDSNRSIRDADGSAGVGDGEPCYGRETRCITVQLEPQEGGPHPYRLAAESLADRPRGFSADSWFQVSSRPGYVVAKVIDQHERPVAGAVVELAYDHSSVTARTDHTGHVRIPFDYDRPRRILALWLAGPGEDNVAVFDSDGLYADDGCNGRHQHTCIALQVEDDEVVPLVLADGRTRWTQGQPTDLVFHVRHRDPESAEAGGATIMGGYRDEQKEEPG